ncbi:MAG: MFS transporter [Chloroflexi bacterium]|nr:MAG: MFS transporter [Chloroflexota bacterium]
MRSAVPSERPRSFSPSLMCSYCRSRFGDHEFCGMCHLRDSALHVACAARTVMRTVEQRRPSYRALFSIPGIPRLVASMLLARTAGQMTSLILVLFALERYGSPTIAGLATFLSIAPGLLVSPIAGALLDRHGRTRLVVLDYSVAAISLALLGALGIADALPVPLLLVIVTVTSLTFPLSHTGVRTLFPILVPQHLWERANAIDSNGYVVSSVFGPAAAGALVAALGAPYALFVPAAISAVAAGIAVGLRDPSTRTDTGQLLADAWRGLVYVVRHPSLRALALGISLANVGWGIFFIALPVLVYTRLGGDAAYVGNLFALLGVVGFLAVLLFGRVSTRGREHVYLAAAIVGQGVAFALAIFARDAVLIAVVMALLGLATGPFDVTLFTVRQRRTDLAWMGRAFAVSMALNFAGFPIGTALGGAIVPLSIDVAIVVAILGNVSGAIVCFFALPREHAAGPGGS